jgi:hypothetical protein
MLRTTAKQYQALKLFLKASVYQVHVHRLSYDQSPSLRAFCDDTLGFVRAIDKIQDSSPGLNTSNWKPSLPRGDFLFPIDIHSNSRSFVCFRYTFASSLLLTFHTRRINPHRPHPSNPLIKSQPTRCTSQQPSSFWLPQSSQPPPTLTLATGNLALGKTKPSTLPP